MLTFLSLALVFGLPDFEAFFTVPISAFFSNGLVDVNSTYTYTYEYIFNFFFTTVTLLISLYFFHNNDTLTRRQTRHFENNKFYVTWLETLA